jgi:NADH-quinone oxidoreductase subunit M
VIFSAAYVLWLVARMLFGKLKPELAGIKDLDYREILCLSPLVIGTIFFGLYPQPLIHLSAASVEQLVENYQRAISTVKAAAVLVTP